MPEHELSMEGIFKQTAKFSKINLDEKTTKYIELRNKDILSLEVDDIKKRIKSRNRYGIALMVLLYIQNIFVFSLVGTALYFNRLESLQFIFATLVTATLGETVFTINIIIKWLFKDIHYTLQKSSSNKTKALIDS